MSAKKIGIVVQRYGLEVNGGAELHARLIAEKLARNYDVTVLTSCALDYITWKPHYDAGDTYVNDVKVTRFENSERAPSVLQHQMDRKFRGRHLKQKIYRISKHANWWKKLVPSAEISFSDGVKWLEMQGPAMPALVDYIKLHQQEYDAFIMFSAIYYPAAMAILTVPHKAIVVPTMHDERPAYYPIYQQVMSSPQWILFNSAAEQRFCEKVFPIANVKKQVVALGINIPHISADPAVPQRYGLTSRYIIYVGRIDEAKGCNVLIDLFNQYISETGERLTLVMVGKSELPVSHSTSVIFTGFVSDEDKQQLMKQAEALIIPSVYESLSMVLLESFALKVPVIAPVESEVLKDHIDSSDGGWYYKDYSEFKHIMHEVVKNDGIKSQKGEAGFNYVQQNYTWSKVLEQYDHAIADVSHTDK
jgi:glycosyltransferase involved in cell wall biosynthesis